MLHQLREKKWKASTANVTVSALRLFYQLVAGRSIAEVENALPRLKEGVRRSQVYSTEEVEQLLQVPGLNLMHRTLLMTAYAAGLRVSEVCNSKPNTS